MQILNVKFRANSDVECLLALHSATFVLLTTKNYIFGFREIFGGECFVMEMFSFFRNRNKTEFAVILHDIGIAESEFEKTLAEFSELAQNGGRVELFSVATCHNRITERQ